MSGGTFNGDNYRINDIAEKIREVIETNNDINEYGDPGRGYSEQTISKFRHTVDLLNKVSVMVHRIDYLLAGDDGEDDFHERLDEELKEIE
jgi:hypothetical protein